MENTREALAEKQRQWMQQRQAVLDRKKAIESLGGVAGSRSDVGPGGAADKGGGCAASSSSSSQPGGNSEDVAASIGGAQVLDKLAEQIAARLQVEVRKENARLMQDGAVGAQVESLLERHIASNNCPVCFELMTGTEHAPTLLFPCGHTFCHSCLRTHLEQRSRHVSLLPRAGAVACAERVAATGDRWVCRAAAVPLVRGDILPELVQGQENVAAAAQQQQQQQQQQQPYHVSGSSISSLAPCHGEAPIGGSLGGVPAEAVKYAEQYRAYSMRCRVMRNQRLESEAEGEALAQQQSTASAVLDHLTREEEAARQRLEAARVELEVVQLQRQEQAQKLDSYAGKMRELEQMSELVGQTHASLEAERAKVLLLAQLAPQLADSPLESLRRRTTSTSETWPTRVYLLPFVRIRRADVHA